MATRALSLLLIALLAWRGGQETPRREHQQASRSWRTELTTPAYPASHIAGVRNVHRAFNTAGVHRHAPPKRDSALATALVGRLATTACRYGRAARLSSLQPAARELARPYDAIPPPARA